MKKPISYVLILLLVSLFSIGCGKTSQPTQATTPSSTENGKIDTSSKPTTGNSDALGAKLSTAYADMMKNNKYLMKYKMTSKHDGEAMEIESTLAVSGDNKAITSKTAGVENTIITKGEKTYMLNNSEKTVMELPQVSALNTSNQNQIKTNGLTYVSSGVEDGLSYEKYSTTDGVIKYYFDGNKLIKFVVETGGQTMVMNIIDMSSNVSDSMFEIPADYKRISIPG